MRSSLDLGIKQLYSNSHNKIEVLILECVSIDCILVCIYKPPIADSDSFHCVLSEVQRVLNTNNGECKTIIVAGDFNLPIVDWQTKKISGGTRDVQRQAEELMALCEEFFMNQCINKPTRQNNILDLFFTNNEDLILKIHVDSPTIISDHNLQCITTCFVVNYLEDHADEQKDCFQSLNFNDNTIDWYKINQDIMEINWNQLFFG